MLAWKGHAQLRSPHVIASSPLVFTRDKSFRDGPLGRFAPRSHSLTSFGLTLRYWANTP